ncbi:Predicted Co/Zn/Cd cation transporter, cation efflux family [Kaistia soli DSM 19436]|uniref:Predicted Co/Zn/Cd cation transporter, cation efflux family n=1 Tax=Kaistia soli DSM 19436 TaxID=1122133 RepID=A0A1M4V0F0_9HYPH|nr:cation transporter [Kaistia soli]SHE62373.1 Predicted Co/Zn/Cd cation transporter, cation efflux family [Kaistia soli DSM 19436]
MSSPEPSPALSVNREQAVLRISVVATVALAVFGVLIGLMTGSSAIIFDGVYALTDAVMTLVALSVASLIASSTSGLSPRGKLAERFTMGFWHLEPIVLLLNGTLLMGAATYALINAVMTLLAGGNDLPFEAAMLYAAIAMTAAAGMAFYCHRANRAIGSDFIALDTKSWLMSSALSAALLVAFVFGWGVENTRLAGLAPFVDPAALALVCLAIIPIPIGTVRRALADILLVTPPGLKQEVDAVAAAVVAREGFLSYRAYVARVGRGKQIEIYFIVPAGRPAQPLEAWDRLRDEIGTAIGGESPDRWLTIAFTTDPEWAD